jgi:predicted DsbA family dithiol-disulfide isomerase
MAPTAPIILDVFADVACPWCWIGERRLAHALAARPGLPVVRRWRPFELQPDLPAGGMPWGMLVETKFGGRARATPMFERVAAIGAEEGLSFRFERMTMASRTRDAHRVILHAAQGGREWDVAEALWRAHFTDGANLGDAAVLRAAAVGAGLDAAEVDQLLAGDEHAAAVTESQQEAALLGVTGVPFVVLDGRLGVSGAQPVEVFLRALDEAAAG